MYSEASGSLECRPCGRGFYSAVVRANSSSACQRCASTANQYTSQEGATACEECPPGSYIDDRNSSLATCVPCMAGTYMSADMNICALCEPGGYMRWAEHC